VGEATWLPRRLAELEAPAPWRRRHEALAVCAKRHTLLTEPRMLERRATGGAAKPHGAMNSDKAHRSWKQAWPERGIFLGWSFTAAGGSYLAKRGA
jgi:hypothetical protein